MKQIQVELQETMGSDISIANSAWTSTYDKERREGKYDDPETVENIVRRLIRDGHSVPVESVIFRFWYRLPIFADRQHMTHRIASHNGLSGRYRTMPSDFYRLPDDIEKILDSLPDSNLTDIVRKNYHMTLEMEWDAYEQSIDILKKAWKDNDISNFEYKRCREVIRGILGTSFMVERTSIFNLRSFCNYMKLRKNNHAQPEIRYIAEEMHRLVKERKVCPVALEELNKKGWTV